MQNKKRWLASLLAIAIAFGDCGGLTALATENDVAANESVSENATVSDKILSDEDLMPETEEPASEEEPAVLADDAVVTEEPFEDTTPEEKLPPLQIGQISEDDTLPSADDDAFRYNLPVSFETDKNLILFVNYDIEKSPTYKEAGTLEWSILRGEKELDAGSASLLDEEDDWDGFETVSTSPYFTMEEITDEESDYCQMMALSFKEDSDADAETYDYYIRAAYYLETENGKAPDFYAAATIPFVPLTADMEKQNQNDTEDTEPLPVEDASVSENSADAADGAVPEDALDDVLIADENDAEDPSADTSENAETDQTTETISTLSENNSMTDTPKSPDEETAQTAPQEAVVTSLTLSEGPTLTMQTEGENSTKQITATVSVEPPADAAPLLSWESSDETVATVTAGDNGTATITAGSEGYAVITASCGGMTASVTVDVVLDAAGNKLTDLPEDPAAPPSPQIRVAGFQESSDDFVYTGQKITQNIRVYHGKTLLKEKTDYTVSYKNNVNAAAYNSAKAPSLTINLKGQYQGSVTLHYTIKPLDLNAIDTYAAPGEDGAVNARTPGYEQTVNYNKNLNIPAPVLTFGKKKLSGKKDFVCDYSLLTEELGGKDYKNGDSYQDGRVYHYTVHGIGNYTGSFQMQLVVLDEKKMNFSTASVKLDKSRYEYSGAPLSKTAIKIESLKAGGQLLDEKLYDYEVCTNGIEGSYVTVFPSESGRASGYRGCKKVSLKLVGDRNIKDAVLGESWQETFTFSQKTVDKYGGIFQPKTGLLAYTENGKPVPLVEGTDYTIKYGNAKKAGTVTVTFKGQGRYTGSVTKKYEIKANADSQNLTIVWGKNVTQDGNALKVSYQKNGASPDFYLRDKDFVVLNSKTDYSVRLKDNKTPGTDMTCTITGKGNYKGFEKTVTLTVTKADISQTTITVLDKPHDTKPDKWKANVTVTDTNGKKLTANTDYTCSYENPGGAQSPDIGTTVAVTVTGTGCYEGVLQSTYRIYDKAKDIGKLKVKIDDQTYTGSEVKLDEKYIHFYATANDMKKQINELKSCFEIVDYKNNTKAGTAKVTLRGINGYGGTKTYSFKILKKKYLINHVKGIALDKTNLSFSIAESDVEKRTLTATITAETNQDIANPTVIWSSSNSNIVSVEEKPGSSAGKRPVTSSAILILKKEGSVTITAVSQDGNKKAQCKVTVTDAPILLEAGQTITENVGSTYQLHMEFAETQDKNNLKWESSNPDKISVDQNGLLTMKQAGAAIIKAVYTSGQTSFTQQCYAVAVEENETPPEPEAGALLTYRQQNGVTDDTPYINKMLRDYEWGDDTHEREVTLYIPAGVYHIDAAADGKDLFGKDKFGGIVLTTNQKLVMSDSALLVALPNSTGHSQVINITGRKGVTVSGGQIIGERREHKGTGGEWGHGIAVFGGTDITIENVDISQCWGDGIYLGLYNGWDDDGNPKKFFSNNVTITNCNLHHNRRNNLSITDVSNVTVKNCAFNYASGTDPQYGIDIEPNKDNTCSNVTISDCTFRGNANGTIQILGQLNAHVKGVTIENCKGDKAPVDWAGFGGSVSGLTYNNNNWNWK